MCLICVEIAKEKMTIREARGALKELVVTDVNSPDYEHFQDLQNATDDELLKKAKQFKMPIR